MLTSPKNRKADKAADRAARNLITGRVILDCAGGYRTKYIKEITTKVAKIIAAIRSHLKFLLKRSRGETVRTQILLQLP